MASTDEGAVKKEATPSNPYAMLDRGQSKRAPSVPVGDCLQAVMSLKTEAPPYEDLINFPRAKDKDEIRCVMCGLPPGAECVIPRQNKDVCKECDKATWQHVSTSVYFKWCKGCKKFLRLGSFSEKLDAAKCDRCRERGRQSYLLKKGKDGGSGTTSGSRSRSCSITSNSSDRDDLHELELAAAAAAIAAVASRVRGNSSCSAREMLDGVGNLGRVGKSAAAHTVSSGEDEERDLADFSLSPYSDIDDDAGVRAVRALRARSPGFGCGHGRGRGHAGSEDAHSYGRATLACGHAAAEEPVVIDDDCADVTKSKLSSVFGKPLKALSKRRLPNNPDESGSASGSDCGSCSASQGCEGGHDAATVHLRGTLYELACIHQRIMTLEEHAAKVQRLEAQVVSQEGQMDQMRQDATTLRAQMAAAKAREDTSLREAERLRAECGVLRERQSALETREAELTQRLSESDALNALSTVMERVQKRPRLVSLGE